ncbi:MAG: SH3 domain-containing protein [Gammaproteobacteria bacterium]
MSETTQTIRHALAIAATSLLMLQGGLAQAQTMVSVNTGTLNMREAPGTGSPVMWKLSRGYPLKVVQRKGSWFKVRDFEGDDGWVARSLTSRTPHHVVKSKVANLRAGPGTGYRIKGKLEYGETVRTVSKQGQWVKVRHQELGQGWVARRLLWGW